MLYKIFQCLLFASLLLFFIPISFGLKDLGEAYCEALNYTFKIEKTELGEKGVCILPNNQAVDAWAFYEGKEGKGYDYCSLINSSLVIVKDREICRGVNECVACEFSNGTKVPVMVLLNISLKEEVCGDGICAIGENYGNCPQDCPSGGRDGYCDGVQDGICDPDCVFFKTPEKDPDCVKERSICGNRICETGETQENCCKDCGCPSGYNCIENKCVKTSSPLIYLIFALILAILVAMVILQSKKFHPQS